MTPNELQASQICHRLEGTEPCEERGEWVPIFVIKNPAYTGPIKGMLGLKVCTHHKERTTIWDVMSEKGFVVIQGAVRAMGLPVPKHEDIALDWQRYSDVKDVFDNADKGRG